MAAPLLRDDPSLPTEMVCLCCGCQRERSADDQWREHTPTTGERVTHGICPACLDTLYPDYAPLVRPSV